MNQTTGDLLRASELPAHEAIRLAMVASGMSRSHVLIGTPIDDHVVEAFRNLAARRRSGEPLQYIEGSVPFGPVVVAVDPRVLIPRPETEELFEIVVELADRPRLVVDLGTGSGNLGIALASSFPASSVYATDVSRDACDLARANAERNGVELTVLHGDLFDPLPIELKGRVDLVVANPPYLRADEFATLPSDVLMEPMGALVAGPEGTEVLQRIATDAREWLAPGGIVACEISEFHGDVVRRMFSGLGGRIMRDIHGKDRFVVGVRDVG